MCVLRSLRCYERNTLLYNRSLRELKQQYDAVIQRRGSSVNPSEIAEFEERLQKETSGRIELEQKLQYRHQEFEELATKYDGFVEMNRQVQAERDDISEELEKYQTECTDLRAKISNLEEQVTARNSFFDQQIKQQAMELELEWHWMIQKEREKWEEREQ